MKAPLLATLIWLALCLSAQAQPQCPVTPAQGTKNTMCASTAFVTGGLTNIDAGNITTGILPPGRTDGHMGGTATNDNAAAGEVGEFIEVKATFGSSTVTITNASPGIVSWTAHGLNTSSVVSFTTTVGLPTGLTVGTTYYICSAGLTANAFAVATSVANAIAGTCINTSSAGSGVQTANNFAVLSTGVTIDTGGFPLTAGDWEVYARTFFVPAATTVQNNTTYTTVSLVSGTADTSSISVGMSIPLPQSGATGGNGWNAIVPPVRKSLAGTTTIFIDATASFTTSTDMAVSYMAARRVR